MIMVNISGSSIAWMCFTVVCLFLLSNALQCDRSKEYPVLDKFNITRRCMRCKTCKPGEQPEIPCGTPVGRYVQIGPCRPCKNGTYSATVNTKPCEVCQSEKCFKHQVVQGICFPDQIDETKCLDKCYNGYILNNDKTACEDPTLLQNTTGKPTSNPTISSTTTLKPILTSPTTSEPTALKPITNPTTSKPTALNPITNPTTSKPTALKLITNPTTSKPTALKPITTSKLTTLKLITSRSTSKPTMKSTRDTVTSNQQVIIPVAVLLPVFLIVMAIISYKYIWPWCKKSQALKQDEESEEDEELLDVSVGRTKEPGVQIIKEEDSKEPGSQANGKPICLETSGGRFGSTPIESGRDVNRDMTGSSHQDVSKIANDTITNTGYANTPPGGNDLVFERAVQSPAQMGALREPEGNQGMVPARQPPNPINSTGFDNLDCELYDEICSRFDTGPPGQDATALACWLSLTVREKRRFQNKENKADFIIQTWSAKSGNTFAKFVSILSNHGMTSLVDDINAYIYQVDV